MKAILNCYDTPRKARRGFYDFLRDIPFLIPHSKVYQKDLRVELPSGTVVFFRDVTDARLEHAIAGQEYTWVVFDPLSEFSNNVRVLCWSRVRL